MCERLLRDRVVVHRKAVRGTEPDSLGCHRRGEPWSLPLSGAQLPSSGIVKSAGAVSEPWEVKLQRFSTGSRLTKALLDCPGMWARWDVKSPDENIAQ